MAKKPSPEVEALHRSVLCLRDAFDQGVVIGLPVDKAKMPVFSTLDPTMDMEDQIALVQVVLTTMEELKDQANG